MKLSEGVIAEYLVAANAVIREGAPVTVDASGYATELGVAAGARFLGIATAHVDNTGGAAGDKRVTVLKQGHVSATVAGGLNQSNIGAIVYADGYDAALKQPRIHGTSTGRTAIGTLVEIAGTSALVRINTV